MEIPLRKKEAPVAMEEMEHLISEFLVSSTAKEVSISTQDSSIFTSWKSGPTLGELLDAIPSLNTWAVTGTSELVGRYQLSKGKHKGTVITDRAHSPSELSLAVVRFRNSKNRMADTTKDADLRELFEILEGAAPVEGFQLPDLMSSALLEHAQDTYDFEAAKSEIEVIKELSEQLDRVGYDILWNEAFLRIE